MSIMRLLKHRATLCPLCLKLRKLFKLFYPHFRLQGPYKVSGVVSSIRSVTAEEACRRFLRGGCLDSGCQQSQFILLPVARLLSPSLPPVSLGQG